jgi:bifunctional non-homologous end joining protein LigD
VRYPLIVEAVDALPARSCVIDGEAVAGDGDIVLRHACALGLEGIVSKRLGSRYVSGRSRAWLEFKNPSHPLIRR